MTVAGKELASMDAAPPNSPMIIVETSIHLARIELATFSVLG